MRWKAILGLGIAICVLCIIAESASAYVRYNPQGPDRRLFPGYQWTVLADTTAEELICLRWMIAQTPTWHYVHCQKVETPADAWICTIPDEIPDAEVTYQFYKAAAVSACDPNGNTSEWTSPNSFDTVIDSITLNQPNLQTPYLRASLIGLLWVVCGAIVIVWRHRQR
ncbi:MAG: hypothetical protein JW892_04450 [Anaerolineae bacterium]|nr:hypothetical protein [Anaerolineae bacterium]